MKKLLLILLLATNLHAETVATAQNDGGGILVLTNVKCNDKKSMVAYTTITSSSKTLFGCWFVDDNFVFIAWSDGDTRTYPFYIWDVKKKGSSM